MTTQTTLWANTILKMPSTTLTAHWVNTASPSPPEARITLPTHTETAIWIDFPPTTSSGIETRPHSSQTSSDSSPTTPSDDLPQAITPSPIDTISAEQTGTDGNEGLGKGKGDTADSFVQSSGTDRRLGKGTWVIIIGSSLPRIPASAV